MFARVRILIPLLALAPFARAAERDVERTFPVRPGCTLKIDTYRGNITVEESDAPEIKLALHLEIGADDEAQADRIRAALQLDMTAAGNAVAIRARNPRETGLHFDWKDQYDIDLTYQLTVPRECSVDLATRTGRVTVGNLTGQHRARVESGLIFFRRIAGSINAQVGDGSLVVSRCLGPVTLRVGRGVIRTGTLGGRAELKNDSGDIEVLAAEAGLVAECTAGQATVGLPKNFSGESRITTSGGNIVLNLDPAARCTIEASSVWGHVESKLPLAVESGALGKSKVTAKLNGGGPRVTLHADGGHVKILPGEMFFEDGAPNPPPPAGPAPKR